MEISSGQKVWFYERHKKFQKLKVIFCSITLVLLVLVLFVPMFNINAANYAKRCYDMFADFQASKEDTAQSKNIINGIYFVGFATSGADLNQASLYFKDELTDEEFEEYSKQEDFETARKISSSISVVINSAKLDKKLTDSTAKQKSRDAVFNSIDNNLSEYSQSYSMVTMIKLLNDSGFISNMSEYISGGSDSSGFEVMGMIYYADLCLIFPILALDLAMLVLSIIKFIYNDKFAEKKLLKNLSSEYAKPQKVTYCDGVIASVMFFIMLFIACIFIFYANVANTLVFFMSEILIVGIAPTFVALAALILGVATPIAAIAMLKKPKEEMDNFLEKSKVVPNTADQNSENAQ